MPSSSASSSTAAGSSGAADPDPTKPVGIVKQRQLHKDARAFTNPVTTAKGARQAWFVQFKGSGAVDAAERARRSHTDSLEGRIYGGLSDLTARHEQSIRSDYPAFWRRAGGYRLDRPGRASVEIHPK